MNGAASRTLTGIHVLVVEYREESRQSWERALRCAGALVVTSGSVRKAFEYCASIRFDVIVTNLSMPGKDGVWLAEQLRARGQRVPIIAVSASEPPSSSNPVALFNRVLPEPLDTQHLVEVIATVVA